MRPRTTAVTASDGTQRRLRYGLGEHVPYRWRGTPGWNPARVLDAWRSGGRMTRECAACGAPPGGNCRTRGGGTTRTPHRGR